MFEFWIKMKILTEYIIPLTIFAIILLGGCVGICFRYFDWNRKVRYLKSHRYERYLAGVPAFGNGSFYAWRNKQKGKHINELTVRHMSYKSLVRKIEEMEV